MNKLLRLACQIVPNRFSVERILLKSLMSTKKWTLQKIKQIWFTWTNLIFEFFDLRLIE